MDLETIEHLCRMINKFIENKDNWEIRHSGILVLKYLVAALNTRDERETIKIILNMTFENVLLCISDLDDDVRQVATQTLVPISKELTGFLDNQQSEQLMKVLIDVLLIIDDLSTSSTSIMGLLCDLLKYESNLKIFLNLFDLNEFLKRLCPYIKQNNLNVKQMTLDTFNKIFQILNKSEKHQQTVLNQKILQSLFRLLYQQVIVETNLKCLESIVTLWSTLCTFTEFNNLIQTCFPYITTWLLLLMHPAQQPIDAIYLIHINDDNDACDATASTSKKEYIGGSQQIYEECKKRDELVVQCRVYAARLLAFLFNRIGSGNTLSNLDLIENRLEFRFSIQEADAQKPPLIDNQQKPIDSITNFLISQISYKSGLNRICFALIMIEWGNLMVDNQTEQHKRLLANKILELLNENTVYYDEISMLFTRMQKECKTLTATYRNQLNFSDDILNLTVYTFEDALNLVEFLKQNMKKFNSTEYDTILSCIQQLNDLIQKTSNEQDSLQLRSNSLLACASISCKNLPDKMNPLLRPLMESIRLEGLLRGVWYS